MNAPEDPRTVPVVEFRHATVRFGSFVAVHDMSFAIPDVPGHGEFITVLGPSGCGKSTLLKIAAGLVPPTTGEVTIDGRPVRGPFPDVGFVFQSAVLLPWRTVLDNVLLPIEFRKWPMANYRQSAADLLAMVGLSEFAQRYPFELSGGMQQRTAIVRALVQDPRLLLMDEPFGALDAMTREQMNLELMRIWSKSDKTVIFITHSIAEAVFLGDRVWLMAPAPGRIVRTFEEVIPKTRGADPMEVQESKAFKDAVAEIGRAFREVEKKG